MFPDDVKCWLTECPACTSERSHASRRGVISGSVFRAKEREYGVDDFTPQEGPVHSTVTAIVKKEKVSSKVSEEREKDV
jgi:hypothetical protein